MSLFKLYFILGFEHLLDFEGYDHILFISTLCSVYYFRLWKQVLVLVTSFTIGHSLTLLLATLNYIKISSDLIEFLIPVTIFVTAITNIFNKSLETRGKHHNIKYIMALFFGLIHGLGFSNYLRAFFGKEESIIPPLLSFNVGLEIGQIVVVGCILSIAFFFTNIIGAKSRDWNLVLSGCGLGISLILMIERFPF